MALKIKSWFEVRWVPWSSRSPRRKRATAAMRTPM